jgi:peptide/nickel transport system permease protein
MLIYLFGVNWHLLPPGGINSPGVAPGVPMVIDRLQYLPLPTLALGLVFMASFTRYTRSSMLEVVRQDFVRTARAKGLPGRVVIRRHALRNALIPLVTVLGVAIPGVLAGAPLTETVFSWPGVGKLLVDSTLGGDYAVAQGIIMFISMMVILANLLVDVAYGVLDPRIRYD